MRAYSFSMHPLPVEQPMHGHVEAPAVKPPPVLITRREIVKNDLKRRQWASRRLKSTVTSERFDVAARARVRTMPVC